MTAEILVDFLLFDLDGTLVDSSAIVERSWSKEIDQHNEIYPENKYKLNEFLSQSHGTRSVEVFKKFFPYKSQEPKVINEWEKANISMNYHLGCEINGAGALINKLRPFKSNWAIVTSGTRDLAHGWFEDRIFNKSSKPSVFVTADDVSQGKPNPAGYLLAFAQLSNLNTTTSPTAVVFEDAPVGIQSGRNAGFEVIGITSTFDKDVLTKAGASYVIQDLSKINVIFENGKFLLKLDIL